MDQTTPEPGESRLETLRLLRDLTQDLGFPPTLKVLAKKRRLSIPGVKKQLDWMQGHGLLSKRRNQPRTVVLTESGRRVLKNYLDRDRAR